MKTLIKTAAAAFAFMIPVVAAQTADAGHGHYQGGFGGYSGNNVRYSGGYSNGYSTGYSSGYNTGYSRPIYDAPSVHFDKKFHPTSTHWTPSQGLHTHGHFDTVPHYTPGHFDSIHNGHVDLNPQFHN